MAHIRALLNVGRLDLICSVSVSVSMSMPRIRKLSSFLLLASHHATFQQGFYFSKLLLDFDSTRKQQSATLHPIVTAALRIESIKLVFSPSLFGWTALLPHFVVAYSLPLTRLEFHDFYNRSTVRCWNTFTKSQRIFSTMVPNFAVAIASYSLKRSNNWFFDFMRYTTTKWV